MRRRSLLPSYVSTQPSKADHGGGEDSRASLTRLHLTPTRRGLSPNGDRGPGGVLGYISSPLWFFTNTCKHWWWRGRRWGWLRDRRSGPRVILLGCASARSPTCCQWCCANLLDWETPKRARDNLALADMKRCRNCRALSVRSLRRVNNNTRSSSWGFISEIEELVSQIACPGRPGYWIQIMFLVVWIV